MKVLLYTRHEYLGASSRYRTLQYIPFLRQAGAETIHRPFFTDAYLQRRAAGGGVAALVLGRYLRRIWSLLRDVLRCDAVVVEKELLPFLPGWAEAWLKRSRKRLYLDYDDAAWHAYRERRWPLNALFGDKLRRVIRGAHVIAGSEHLAEQCRAWGAASVTKIPTCVSRERYTGQGLTAPKTADIVWIGSRTTARFLLPLIPVFEALAARRGLSVRLIGAPGDIAARMPDCVTCLPWSGETEVDLLASAKIGVMPLPDEPFARGKCGFKLVQYMGAGLPVVGSPVGENVRIIEEGENGFLASAPEDWLNALTALLSDDALRARLGRGAHATYLERYTTEAAAARYARLIMK